MMDFLDNPIFQSIILGIIQGISEFFPISSSAHLTLIPNLLGWQGVINSLSFDLALHIGTTLALLIYFWREWFNLTRAFIKSAPSGFSSIWSDSQAKLFSLIILSCLPAGLIGFLFENYFATQARSTELIAALLIIFGVILFISDRLGKKNRNLESITWIDSLSIGLSQALALLPGVSRSGITITSGLFRGLTREDSARFSFLLSTPTILGASLFKLKDVAEIAGQAGNQNIFLAGMIASAISGFLAIRFLLRFLTSSNFDIFVFYRIILGLAILSWLLAGNF